MPTTTYMLLVLPTPGVTNDFTGEQEEVAAFTTIDAHDHTPGKGTLVPTAGLNINADLPFAGFNASGLRAVRMNSQSSSLALLLDVNCIYSSGGNLYFNNGSGQAVQITSGSTLSASSIGGISGLAAPASVAYSGGTYVFTSNTNIAAIVDVGPVVIRDTGASAKGITLQSPVALAAAYAITLPSGLPAGTFPLTMTSAGVMAASLLTTAHLSASAGILGSQLSAAAGIVRGQLASVGQQVSSSCGTFSNSGGALVDVTNLSVGITTTGRPVIVALISDGSVSAAGVTNNSNAAAQVALDRGGSTIAIWSCCNANTTAALANLPSATFFGSGGFVHIDPVAAGTYTYKIRINPGGSALSISNYKLAAYEL